MSNIILSDNDTIKRDVVYSTNWATISYPESSNIDDIIEYLKRGCYSAVISPLHDKDLDKYGNIKKEHYHIQFIFKSKKSEKQIKELTTDLKCVGQERIMNKEAYYYYLWHDEQCDKALYNPNDVIYINCSENDFINHISVLNNLIDIIINENVVSFSQLRKLVIDYYGTISNPIVYVLSNKTNLLSKFINDNIYRNEKKYKEILKENNNLRNNNKFLEDKLLEFKKEKEQWQKN